MAPRARMLLLALLLGAVGVALAADPPYPPSPVITDITWASSASQDASGSDLWPMTWADDDLLYTSYGDGWGFDYPPGCPKETSKLSTGWATVGGPPDAYQACNIDSNDEPIGDGKAGKKAYGILSVEGTLYAAMSNADGDGHQCEIWMSGDHGINWTDAGWDFAEFGVCVFLNFGRNYSGARDDYVYMYSPNTDSAYFEADGTILARVPRAQVMVRSAWRFFSGLQGGQPTWSAEVADRVPVFEFPGGCNRQDVVYVPALDRYLMTMRSRGRGDAANPNHFSLYDAPEPWGPWTTVYYTESSLPGMSPMDTKAGGWGESLHIPSKWIAADGEEFWLVYSGDDSFRIRQATLSLAPGSNLPPSTPGNLERTDDDRP